MEDNLYRLYNVFYQREMDTPEARRIGENHKTLIGSLGKQERKLILRIIDDKDLMIERSTYNAFVSGFRLAMELSMEIRIEGGHSTGDNREE